MSWVDAVVQGVLLGGLFALFACGLSLMFGVMEVINLAHGDIAVAAGYLAVVLVPLTHIPALWIFILVVPVFTVGGYVMQRGVLQRTVESGPLTTLLVTFGLAIVLENVLLEVFTGNSHSLDLGSFVSDSIRITSEIQVADLSLLILGVAVVVIVILQLFLSRTTTGRMIRAIADDREASRLVGADPRHLFGVAAGIAFGTVALAGLALAMYSEIDPTAGPNYLIYAFEAVVIGGLGSLWGTLVGGIALGIATTVGLQISANFGALGPHLLFLAVLAVRPQGLFPKRVYR